MKATNVKSDYVDGISCSVDECTYHCAGNKCTAGCIQVGGNCSASCSEETECSTFRAR